MATPAEARAASSPSARNSKDPSSTSGPAPAPAIAPVAVPAGRDVPLDAELWVDVAVLYALADVSVIVHDACVKELKPVVLLSIVAGVVLCMVTVVE